MDYTLDSYAGFDEEQQILATAAKKKADLEHQKELKEKEILYRLKTIKEYYLRMSWMHKKEYILSILRQITCFDTLLQIINYISTLYGKMAAYTNVSPTVRNTSQQILLDHDRTLENCYFKEKACEDINWIATLDKSKQMNIITDLLSLGGGGLMRKLYIPLVSIYNKKLLGDKRIKEESKVIVDDAYFTELLNKKFFDDSDKYPQDHPLSIEVEKMRKKWDEILEKTYWEVFGSATAHAKEEIRSNKTLKIAVKKTATTKTFSKQSKESKATYIEEVDWFQMLPIWIVKKILSYLNQKTLQSLTKVNHYWSYASDSILQERQARKILNHSISKMRSNVDLQILEQCDKDTAFLKEFYGSAEKPNSPREKRLKKLMNRGAIIKEMVPRVNESQQIQSNLLTTILQDNKLAMPLDRITVFPRLIKEDLLLYKSYPCFLKDVNILIDVAADIRKQRNTLSYSLSQQLSDTFSMTEANLEDW